MSLLPTPGFKVSSVAAATALLSMVAMAQTTEPPRLDEVTVEDSTSTAGFRSKAVELGPLGTRDILNTPYSVHVVGHDMIENQQASSLNDLLKYLPSTQMQARGGADVGRPQTRGMQSSVVANNHMDGLNVVGTTAYPMELLERIEVIQSLSGAFYGPASPAGNFNFIQKRPTEATQRRLTMSHTSDAALGVHADLSGAVDAHRVLTYRANLLHEEGVGYVEGSTQRRKLASLALDVRPQAGTLFELNASRYEFVRRGFPGSFAYSQATGLPSAPDPTRVGYGQSYAGLDLDTTTLSARAVQRLGADWRLTAGVLRQVADRSLSTPTHTLSGPHGRYATAIGSPATGRFVVDSNLLHANGKVRLGSSTHDVVVGTSGFQWNIHSYPRKNYALGQASMDNPMVFPEPQWAAAGSRYRAGKDSQQSLILGDTITFNEQWSLILGASWGQMRTRSYNAAGAQTDDDRKSGWSPTVAAVFKPAEDTSLYVSYADSLEQAGAAPTGTVNEGSPLSPFRSRQWEAGAKRNWGKLHTSAALFRIERPFAYTDPVDNRYKVQGNQVNTGLELSASGQVAPGLHVYGGATFLNPKLKNTGRASTSNKQVVGVPRMQANLLVEYQVPSARGLAIHANLHHTGRRAANDMNTQWLGAFQTLDLGARYSTRISGVATTWRLSVNNVLDKHYWMSVFPGSINGNGASYSAFLGSPRELRLSMSVDL